MYEVYSRPDCIWCERAVKLLEFKAKSFAYNLLPSIEIRKATLDEWEVPEGERTWPQIFLDGKRIGGYTELKAHLTATT